MIVWRKDEIRPARVFKGRHLLIGGAASFPRRLVLPRPRPLLTGRGGGERPDTRAALDAMARINRRVRRAQPLHLRRLI